MTKRAGRPAPLTHEAGSVSAHGPYQATQRKSESCSSSKSSETLPASLPLPPDLAMMRAQFTPCDCSRKPRVAKGHCVRFAQSMLLDTLALHTTSPVLCPSSAPPDFNTPGCAGTGRPDKRGAVLGSLLLGLESVTVPAPWYGLWPGQVSGSCQGV